MSSVSSLATTSTWSMSCLKSALPTYIPPCSLRLPQSPAPGGVKISLKTNNPISLRSFHGLAPLHPLLSLGMDQQGSESEGIANRDMFLQLTDDILILILSLLGYDLKFLCQCILVSKRFASLIPLISSVTLSIPPPQESNSFKFFEAQVIYASKALKNFRKIRSLHLEFIEEKYREFNLQWKAVLGSKTCTCALLVFDSITKLSSASASVADDQTYLASFWRPIVYPNMWRNVLAVMQPMVESVVITDSKKKGKVCFGNSELRDARICSSISDLWDNRFEDGRTSLKFFKASELCLPKSGFLLKGVYLVINKIGENSPEDHKYDDVLNCDFGEEEKVFGEALNLILKTPEEKKIGCSGYDCGVHISLIRMI